MIPDRKTALAVIEAAYEINPEQWRNHSVVTAFCAEQIAESCGMDGEKAYVFGLLHDIGRQKSGARISHVIRGYDLLKEKGYDECARICLTHSFQTKKMTDYIGTPDISDDEMEFIRSFISSCSYDDYDRLIQLCDSISLADGPVPMEERIADIAGRYGYYPQDKLEKNRELLAYFEKKTGEPVMQTVMPAVIMMCGISGSGKTVYSRRKEKQGYARLSLDEEMFSTYGAFGTDYPAEKYGLLVREVKERQRIRLAGLIDSGKKAVLDYCFCSRAERDSYRAFAAEHGAGVMTVYMKCGLELLKQRVHERNRRIDENSAFIPDALLEQYYEGFERPRLEGELVIEQK
jgi:putative nucleotidyltransferase with HDIG domain